MFKIEKLTVNSVRNVVKREHVAYVDATIDDLWYRLGGKLANLAVVENKKQRLYGNNVTIKYMITRDNEVLDIDRALTEVHKRTMAEIDAVNGLIKVHNMALRRSNNQRQDGIEYSMMEEVKLATLLLQKVDKLMLDDQQGIMIG